MDRFLLDTNVVSQATKAKPDERVARWLQSGVELSAMYISVLSLAEIRYGIEDMASGRKRSNLEVWLERDLPEMFRGRMLPVDASVSDEAGRMMARRKAEGRRPDVADALIGATAKLHGLKLATLNRKDFEKLPVQLATF